MWVSLCSRKANSGIQQHATELCATSATWTMGGSKEDSIRVLPGSRSSEDPHECVCVGGGLQDLHLSLALGVSSAHFSEQSPVLNVPEGTQSPEVPRLWYLWAQEGRKERGLWAGRYRN